MLSMSTQMFAARAAPTRAHTRAAAAQDNKVRAKCEHEQSSESADVTFFLYWWRVKKI
jgi:hypothetical protein